MCFFGWERTQELHILYIRTTMRSDPGLYAGPYHQGRDVSRFIPFVSLSDSLISFYSYFDIQTFVL